MVGAFAMDTTEAVQRIMGHCGLDEPADASQGRYAKLATQRLTKANKDVQGLGWPENTEDKVILEKDSNDEYNLPEMRVGLSSEVEIISIRPTGKDASLLVTRRGDHLVWRDDSISTGTPWIKAFDDDLEVTRILLLPFEWLPDHLANYVAMRAARAFFPNVMKEDLGGSMQKQMVGRELIAAYLEAKTQAEQHKAQTQRVNLLDTDEALRVRGRRRGFNLIAR